MTLKEAVDVLILSKECEFEGSAEDLERAQQLGIEALWRVHDYRNWQPLPSEDLEL